MSNHDILQYITTPKNILKWEAVKRQMTLDEFVTTFDRDERTKHINHLEIKLDTGHKHAVYQAIKGSNKEKAGQILGTPSQKNYAILNLKKFILETYNIELVGPQTRAVNLCHLCDHNSKIKENNHNKHTCISPLHVYFGTASENQMDKPLKVRARSAITQMDAGTHNSQQLYYCPNCNRETKGLFGHNQHVNACNKKHGLNYSTGVSASAN